VRYQVKQRCIRAIPRSRKRW